jgi:hypothetical protein
MSQELRAAVAELTRHKPYATQREVYTTYFRDADWDKFEDAVFRLSVEGTVANRPHPGDPSDRLLQLTDEGRALRLWPHALERGRRRRHS